MLVKYLSTDELDNSIFNIAGPPDMLKAMQKLLQDDLYIPKSKNKDRRIYWLLNKCELEWELGNLFYFPVFELCNRKFLCLLDNSGIFYLPLILRNGR